MRFIGIAISLMWVPLASAELVLNVNAADKEYFLAGSASGTPFHDVSFGENYLLWDNVGFFGGGYGSLLSTSAFEATGNSILSFEMFLHGNGNINGVMQLASSNYMSLQGNPSVVFSYAEWDPNAIVELESKAMAGEVVAVSHGAFAFALRVEQASVPEPDSLCLVVCSVVILILKRRRFSPRGSAPSI